MDNKMSGRNYGCTEWRCVTVPIVVINNNRNNLLSYTNSTSVPSKFNSYKQVLLRYPTNIIMSYGLKTRVDKYTRMYVVTVEYGTIYQITNLMMWLFKFVTRINFKCDGVMWWSADLFLYIGIWN